MRIAIRHTTHYAYAEPVRSVIQLLRVTPQSFAGQTVLDWQLDVDCDTRIREGRDGYGNIVHRLYVDRPLSAIAITVSGRILTQNEHGVVRGLDRDLPPEVFLRPTPLTAAGDGLAELVEEARAAAPDALGRLHFVTAALHRRMRFDPEATAVETAAEQAWQAGHGVCQDFAQILVAVARPLAIPARYVSGHLFRDDGAHLQEAAHAWAEAWVPDLGWVGFDPANGKSPDDAYVRIACGLDYREAAPIAGARRGGGQETLSVEVAVQESQAQYQSQG